jgi:ATP-dependent RNA helicase DeaD
MTDLPTVATINTKRIAAFKEKITLALQTDTTFFQQLVSDYLKEHQVSGEQLAAALALMAQGGRSLLLAEANPPAAATRQRVTVERTARRSPGRKIDLQLPTDEGMERYRIEIGSEHGIKPGNIVGAIANEAEINSRHIGRISIFDTYSTVDLPSGMPEHILRLLQKSRVGSKMLRLQRWQEETVTEAEPSVRVRPAGRTGPPSPFAKGRKKAASQRLS